MPDDCSYCGLPLRNPYLTDNAQEAAEEIANLKATMRAMLEHIESWALPDTDTAFWCPWCEKWVGAPGGHAPDCLGERARELSK
jgi:hypothetical protein